MTDFGVPNFWEIRNAIEKADLAALEAAISTNFWTLFDGLPPLRFDKDRWDKSTPAGSFSGKDLRTVAKGLSALCDPDLPPSIKWSELSKVNIPFAELLPPFDYRYFHLRGFWSHCEARVLLQLAYEKTTDWSVYDRLDTPSVQPSSFFVPSFAPSKCWNHLALEAGLFSDKDKFLECANFYERAINHVELDNLYVDRKYPLRVLSDFTQMALNRFPEELIFNGLKEKVDAIYEVGASEKISLRMWKSLTSEDKKLKNEMYWLISSQERKREIDHFTMIFESERIHKNLNNLDWAITPRDSFCHLKGYNIKGTEKWQRAFQLAAFFAGSDPFRPSYAIGQYAIETSALDKNKTHRWDRGDFKFSKPVGDLFSQICKVKALRSNLDQYKDGTKGAYRLNPSRSFICIIKQSEIYELVDSFVPGAATMRRKDGEIRGKDRTRSDPSKPRRTTRNS
jgi:hypothetical protein